MVNRAENLRNMVDLILNFPYRGSLNSENLSDMGFKHEKKLLHIFLTITTLMKS